MPLLLLDENNSSIAISFGLIDIGDADKPPKIKMTVRERLDSGIVKVVWSDFLESGSAAGNNGNNAYLFASFLTTSLRDANEDIAQLRADLSKAKADMTGWKDTASKLDNKWQKEKDGLTERFLVLYNRVKSDLRDAKKELSDEKKKKTVTRTVKRVVEKSEEERAAIAEERELLESDPIAAMAIDRDSVSRDDVKALDEMAVMSWMQAQEGCYSPQKRLAAGLELLINTGWQR